MVRIEGIEGLRAHAGRELGVSSWHEVTQADLDAFAATTRDDFWLHVDPARAARGPFGSTIAHGLYTLSLGPAFSYEIYAVEGFSYGVNYGYDRVRFPAPVPVGSRVRMRAVLSAVEERDDGVLCRVTQTFEVEGAGKPACVADALVRFFR